MGLPIREYTKREIEEMADRESARDHRRLRSLGLDPEGDPIDRLMELSRLHKELEERRLES
jgi:hypothetical protein